MPAKMWESNSLVRPAIRWDKRHGTGTIDPVILAPTHEDGAFIDLMKFSPLVSCVMSHFERKLVSFEHLNNWRKLIHLHVSRIQHYQQCSGHKIDSPDGVIPHPINLRRCSISYDIPPIGDWWVFHSNDGHGHLNICHRLIRTQA